MDDQELIFFKDATLHDALTQWKFSVRKEWRNLVDRFIVLHYKKAIKQTTLPSTSVCFNLVVRGSVRMLREKDCLINVPKATIFGVFRGAQQLFFSEDTLLLVIKLKEGAALPLVKSPVHHLYGQFIELNTVYPKEQVALLMQRLKADPSPQALVRTGEKFLMTQRELRESDLLVKQALCKIREKKGCVSIPALTRELYISRDAFEKRFRRAVGTTPKRYANIVRFRSLIGGRYSGKNLTEIGLNAGYFDQSHFIKDFKAYTGRVPSELLGDLI